MQVGRRGEILEIAMPEKSPWKVHLGWRSRDEWGAIYVGTMTTRATSQDRKRHSKQEGACGELVGG